MQYGTVNYVIEAGVTLTILGNNGATERIAFVIDTELTEEITLPHEIIGRLNLTLANYDGDDGMRLLRGSNLNVDAVPGGLVTITELSSASQPETPC